MKRLVAVFESGDLLSRSSRARGLKQALGLQAQLIKLSRSSRARGLKQHDIIRNMAMARRALPERVD